MKPINVPFNIKILDPKDDRLKALRPIRSLAIFDNSGVSFDPDGLFSTLIFGKVGEDMRNEKFSFINIKTTVFHPIIFDALIGNKRLYMDIVSGKGYALWDDKEKDFVSSDPINGKTGFKYFLDHWKDIVFQETNSPERQEAQQVVINYKHVAMTDKVMVIPAAMRDLQKNDDGRDEEDEINKVYRKLLAISNTIPGEGNAPDRDVSDTARFKLQMTFNEIYQSLKELISGKRKLILGKWASRHIADGTRNVLSPLDEQIVELGDPTNIGMNNTVYGLYQAIRACRPVAIFEFKNNFLKQLTQGPGQPVRLINPNTWKQEPISLTSDEWDKWFSDEGIDKLFTLFKNDKMRHDVAKIGKHYLGLLYHNANGQVKLFTDIDQLPEGFDRKDVKPATYAEIIYLSVAKKLSTLPIFVTRYPVASLGSIYASIQYLKTTIQDEKVVVLDDEWKASDYVLPSFPIRGQAFLNTLCPNMVRLEGLNADHDGDVGSANVTFTDESVQEVHDLIKKRIMYVDPKGQLIASANVSVNELVCYNLTR